MALIKCPECYSKISEKAHACPKCGYPLNDQIEMHHEVTFFGGIGNTGVDELAALKSDGWTVVDETVIDKWIDGDGYICIQYKYRLQKNRLNINCVGDSKIETCPINEHGKNPKGRYAGSNQKGQKRVQAYIKKKNKATIDKLREANRQKAVELEKYRKRNGLCINCGQKVEFFSKLFGKEVCKQHK